MTKTQRSPIAGMSDREHQRLLQQMVDGDPDAMRRLLGTPKT